MFQILCLGRMILLKKTDFIIVAVILLVACGLYFSGLLKPQGAGEEVIISVDGKEYEAVSLLKDNKITIESEQGRKNVIAIKDGKVYMEQANCPDKICMGQGEISKGNETIVCLPNRVFVQIKSQTQEIDTIAK